MSTIYLDNDYEPEYELTRRDESSGDEEAAAGLTGLLVWLSATDGGAAIHASLSKSLTERAGESGTYYAVIEGDDLATHLADYRRVYEVFGDGTNVQTSIVRDVRATRRPGS